MLKNGRVTVVALGLVVLSGCQAPMRVATRVREVPRVDLDLAAGNRGYLVGAAPAGGRTYRTTRQIIETDVEIPTLYKPALSGPAPINAEAPAPSAPGAEGAAAAGPAARYDTYVVQRGDSLWSIAAKPEVYGKATRWRRLFDANRNLLSSPDRLKAGMTLQIPREDGADELPEDESSAYTK